MRWRCSFHDAKGIQCPNAALWRMHFAKDHPFDHIDVCSEHLDDYSSYSWLQDIGELNADPPERQS